MYKILKEDTVLATVHNPTWVKLQDNGCFALCDIVSAQGVVIDGVVYHILGKPDITGSETVSLVEVSETTYQLEQKKALEENAQTIAGLGMQLFEAQTQLLQTQKEKDNLGEQLFILQTELIMKGVM